MGGSILIAYGFIGLAASNFLSNLTQLATGDYLRLWSFTILTIVCGFAVILGGFLVASNGRWKNLGGGILGLLGSLVGAILCLGLLFTVVGLSQGVVGLSQGIQFTTSYELLVIGSIPAMFVGFPLGMFGSVAGVFLEEPEPVDNTEQSV
jgi:hypothetical protein